MVLAVGRRVQFYGSPNLKQWEFLSEFTGGCTAAVWECPDMFPLAVDGDPDNIKWVLLVDVQDGEGHPVVPAPCISSATSME